MDDESDVLIIDEDVGKVKTPPKDKKEKDVEVIGGKKKLQTQGNAHPKKKRKKKVSRCS